MLVFTKKEKAVLLLNKNGVTLSVKADHTEIRYIWCERYNQSKFTSIFREK